MIVDFVPEAEAALKRVVERSEDSPNHAVNRAVIIYDLVSYMANAPGGRRLFLDINQLVPHGGRCRITVRRLRWWHRKFPGKTVATSRNFLP